MPKIYLQSKRQINIIVLVSVLLSFIFLPNVVSALSPLQPRHASLPLFRPPNANELDAADAAKHSIVWSAHQPTDSFLVIANGSTIAFACLLDDGGSDITSPLELSWSVEDVSTRAQRRHTLTAQPGSSSSSQKFSFDLGPGFIPARGIFKKFEGSVLSFAFTTPQPDHNALVVACHLRLGGAVVVSSARVRLWDERPTRNVLMGSQSGAGLPCRGLQRQQNPSKYVALDCELMPSPSSSATALLLETAIYALYRCSNPDAASLRLQSNSTDPSAFYAVYFSGRLRLGWSIAGDWNTSDLCVSADTLMPSGQRLLLRWPLQININDENSTAASATVFVPETLATDHSVVNIDLFDDPPMTRALPCPFICLAGSADDPSCKFNWLQSRNASSWSGAIKSPDPSLGSLVEAHRLLLLPWKPPGNPGPPPLAGLWTCQSAASLTTVSNSTPAQMFSVRIAARPSLCGNRPPSRSVVFVPPPTSKQRWSDRQYFSLNCTVCGLDLSLGSSAVATFTQLRLHGSLGGVQTSTEAYSQSLPGGGLELGLRFTQFHLDNDTSGSGSVLVRCHSMDARGRGLVAFSVVEVLPAPQSAFCKADCLNGNAQCRNFRCPLEANLAETLPSLGVSVAYLFTLQPPGGAPPQQILSSVNHLVTHESVTRLRCTQLLYYSDDGGVDEGVSGGRRQRLVPENAAKAAVYRAALGDQRYSRLLLDIESEWLELPAGGRKPSQKNDSTSSDEPESSSDIFPGYRSSGLSKAVNIILIITMVLCCLAAVFLIVAHSFRYKLWHHISGWMRKYTSRRMDEKTPEGNSGDKNHQKRNKHSKHSAKKYGEKHETSTPSPAPTPAEQNPVQNSQVKHVNEQKSDEDDVTEDENKEQPNEVSTSHNAAPEVNKAMLFPLQRSKQSSVEPDMSPKPRQQMLGLISSTSTRATPTPSTVTLTQTIKPSVEIWNSDSSYADFNGSFVSLGGGGSPTVMSWPLPEESKVCRVDAAILSTSESSLKQVTAEVVHPSRYRLCQPTEAVTSSARVCDQQISSNDIAGDLVLGVGVAIDTSSAAITWAGPASKSDRRRPALRIRVRDRPELYANAGTVDTVDDDADSDEATNTDHLLSFFPSPPEAEKIEPVSSNAATHAADIARLARCLICQPPRIRPVPSSIIGVEVSLIGSTTTTGTHSTSNENNGNSSNSSCSCSALNSPETVERKNKKEPVSSSEEIDVPSSDLLPPLMTTSGKRGFGGSMLFATASTAVVEVVESTLTHVGSHQRQQEDRSEDICSTCTCTGTGCSSDSEETSERVAPLQGGSSTREQTNSDVAPQQMQLVLQAVNSAIERLNWE